MRNLLHKTKLEDFKLWLDAQGIKHRPGRGDWQALQVQFSGAGWYCIYIRLDMPEHLSTDRRIDSLVRKFIADRKRAGHENSTD